MANLLSTTVNGSVLVGPSGTAHAYDGAATGKLYFGNQVSDSPTNYHITTNMEDFGGNYSKLDIRWYTGQRFYAHYAYGGFRFKEITTGNDLFSIGEGDVHVRVENNLYIAGNLAIHAGNIGSQSVSYATSAGNADTVDGRHADYFYPGFTDNGYSTGDINGSGTHQRLWGTDSVQNLLAFRPPTSIEYSTDGVNWTATTATTGLWDNKMFGKWGGFNMAVGNNVGGWRYVRMTWVNFGYHFFSHFTLAHSTNGHSFNFVFQKSDLNGVFSGEAFRQNGISSWPGYTFTKHSNVSGWWDTRDIRFVFELNHNNDYPNNSISVGHIGLMGGYSGFTRLYDWDADRNMFFGGVIYAATGNSNNWNTAFGWGNHASAGYQAAATAITTSNIASQSVDYATNSTRLYASDSPYNFGGAAPYYMSMTYDGNRWLLKVTPGTPADVRVSYADSAGSAGSITSQANSATITAATAATINTIALRDASGDLTVRELVMNVAVQNFTPSSMVAIYPTTNQAVKVDASGARAFLNVPTKTGGDASGTWGISITGNANTATTSGSATTAANANHLNTTRDTPSDSLQYWQANGLGLDEAPSTDWHNTIRMGHGSPLSYYSNTLAIRMTGSGVGDIYTQTIMNGTKQGWKKHWNDSNLTNLNQLTNGPGYITGYTETDTLATVTGRGNTTSNSVRFGSHVDLSPTASAFRFYDGTTFRGGFGLDSWGHSGSDSNLVLYVNGDNTLFFSTNGTKRASLSSSAFNSLVTLQQNGNAVIHAGNIANQTVAFANQLTVVGAGATIIDANTFQTGILSNYYSTGAISNIPEQGYGSLYNFGGYDNTTLSLQLFSVINHNTNTPTRELYFRMGNNLGFANDWRTIIDSKNIGSQSVASATTVTHYASRTDGTWYNAIWGAGNPSHLYSCNAVQILSSAGAIRANIYYDNEDTGYYVDPNSESKLKKLWINNGGAGGVGWSTGLNMGDGTNYWNLIQDAGTARQRNFGTGGYDWYNNTASTQLMLLSNAGNLSVHGSITTGGNAVIHAGNIASQSVSYADESGYSASSGSVEWTSVQNKPATFTPSAHNHDDRYYTEAEIDEITHHWQWRWIRWSAYLAPAGGSASQWTDYYKTYFTERTGDTEASYGEQGSGYINTLTSVGGEGGFGGSLYGNIFGDLNSYHCLIYTNIYVDKEFTISVTNFNGDDPHAIFIDGVFVHGNTGCCVDTAYTYTFKQGWHRIDLIYSEGGGGDFIRMGWNPKDYLSNIKDMTPHRGGENPNYVLDKLKGVDGSGSGLDADLLDGYHVQVSAGANTIPTRNSNGYLIPESWIQLNGIYGLYSPTNDAHLRPNNSNYGSWLVTGTRNGWRGLEFDSGAAGNVSLMVSNDSNTSGFHNNSYGWQIKWSNGTLYVGKNSYGGGTEATVLDTSNYSSWAQPASTAINTGNIGSQIVQGLGTSFLGNGTSNIGDGYSRVIRNENGLGGNPNYAPILHLAASDTMWQIAGPHAGQTGLVWRSGYAGTWSTPWWNIMHSGLSSYEYANNMNQYVRTTDNVTFNTTTAPTILVNNHSDNTRGYRIHNTSGSSVSAMFTNSSNQLVIAAGAFDQINLNKKVYVNGVALGVNVAPSATAGRIDASNDIVAYSSSDERLKYNITPIENALDKVKSLTGVEFDWKPEHKEAHGHEGRDTGIIAQQVLAVMPTAVRTNDTGYLAVRYEKLIGLLIEGMKEQQAQIDELKTKLDGLTN